MFLNMVRGMRFFQSAENAINAINKYSHIQIAFLQCFIPLHVYIGNGKYKKNVKDAAHFTCI